MTSRYGTVGTVPVIAKKKIRANKSKNRSTVPLRRCGYGSGSRTSMLACYDNAPMYLPTCSQILKILQHKPLQFLTCSSGADLLVGGMLLGAPRIPHHSVRYPRHALHIIHKINQELGRYRKVR